MARTYGLPAFGDRFTSTPEFGGALSDAAREYRLGWRLGLVPGGPSWFELGVEATRTEPANDAGTRPEHGIRLRLDYRLAAFEFGVEATRTEPADDAGTRPEHGIRLKLDARF